MCYIYEISVLKMMKDDDRIYFYRRAAGEAVENIQSECNTRTGKDWEVGREGWNQNTTPPKQRSALQGKISEEV